MKFKAILLYNFFYFFYIDICFASNIELSAKTILYNDIIIEQNITTYSYFFPSGLIENFDGEFLSSSKPSIHYVYKSLEAQKNDIPELDKTLKILKELDLQYRKYRCIAQLEACQNERSIFDFFTQQKSHKQADLKVYENRLEAFNDQELLQKLKSAKLLGWFAGRSYDEKKLEALRDENFNKVFEYADKYAAIRSMYKL